MTTAVITTVDTPDGPFSIVENAAGAVLASGWTGDHEHLVARIAKRDAPTRVLAGNATATEAVEAYYAGETDLALAVPVAQSGTALFEDGWRALRGIAAGSTATYTQVAQAMGRPAAVRVAASVCARNAAALFVPCHRVVRADGSMGGFAWGLEVKGALLAREGNQPSR